MFWNWFEPWGFMNTERGHHESQFESLSQRLFGLTFWGDYGGDIISRYHHAYLLELAPLAVGSIEAAHGQGLVLIAVEPDNEQYRDQLREVIRFLAYFDPNSAEYSDYPIYDDGDFSSFEWELGQKEMTEGWWAEYEQRELADKFDDWEGNTLVPEKGTQEWANLVNDWFESLGDDYDYPYWEGADTIIVPGWDTDQVAEWLLGQYAKSITRAGNPEVTLEVHYAK